MWGPGTNRLPVPGTGRSTRPAKLERGSLEGGEMKWEENVPAGPGARSPPPPLPVGPGALLLARDLSLLCLGLQGSFRGHSAAAPASDRCGRGTCVTCRLRGWGGPALQNLGDRRPPALAPRPLSAPPSLTSVPSSPSQPSALTPSLFPRGPRATAGGLRGGMVAGHGQWQGHGPRGPCVLPAAWAQPGHFPTSPGPVRVPRPVLPREAEQEAVRKPP